MQANPNQAQEDPILSPFSDSEGRVIPKGKKKNYGVWIAAACVLLAILATGGFFIFQHMSDPLRTLEDFPVAKYMEGYKSLAGSKFRADLRVENDLGWKEGVGRLMVFTLRDNPNPVVVMIPPNLAQIYFTKGQNYKAELEVKEGGLIYANTCRKN